MRYALLALLVALSLSARATEVRLQLSEEASKSTTFHSLNVEAGNISSATEATGTPLHAIDAYRINNYKLERIGGGPPLLEAIDILAQTSTNGFDVLVLREEYNSVSNPLRLLSAMAGHPVQVSKILWVVIKDGTVTHRAEIRREPASYRWNATLFKPEAAAPAQ